MWQLIALIGIGAASWTIKTTFEPEQYEYHVLAIQDRSIVVKVEKATGKSVVVFPH